MEKAIIAQGEDTFKSGPAKQAIVGNEETKLYKQIGQLKIVYSAGFGVMTIQHA